jgi:outer membrane receptor protein involved in Fe transport
LPIKSNYFRVSTLCILASTALAQPTGAPNGTPRAGGPAPTGRIYGKVQEQDKKTPLEYVVLQVYSVATNADGQPTLVTGGLSQSNGDFTIDKVPVGQPLTLVVSFVGYEKLEISFQIQKTEKDLGNIRLKPSTVLSEVVIDGTSPDYRIEFDKRVYEVEKNPINAGGTGEDVLRNIPALQVDMDGNVTMRNSAPQIFVDGRPTTLTIDQIPADAIQRVEVITNPSAKYDASGGGGGIINIVMKRNRTLGYNGSLRAGVDSRPRYNFGGDLSVREGKFNFFINGNYNQRKSLNMGTTERLSYLNQPTELWYQDQNSTQEGYFLNGRGGIDYFMDNRNTFTITQSITRGQFNPITDLTSTTDTLKTEGAFVRWNSYNRYTENDRNFMNLGTSFLYKHLFPKEGTEITADVNFNSVNGENFGEYENRYADNNVSKQKQSGNSSSQIYTAQSDFTTLLRQNEKLEVGVRGVVRDYTSTFQNFMFDQSSNSYHEIKNSLVDYSYLDQVYAAYGTYSRSYDKWSYQVGLRAESSNYLGKLLSTKENFKIQYPVSLFPSLFINKKLTDKQDIQISASRKVNRPFFMQLIPFVDYSDSLNITSGNPALRPEFTNVLEFAHQYNIHKNHSLMTTVYGRYMTDLIVRNQETVWSDEMNQNILLNTFTNAGASSAVGVEFILRNKFTQWFELTSNFNLYHSDIDGTNIDANLKNSQNSWWVKTNAMFRLPKGFSFQAMFDYSAKRSLTVTGSGDGGGRGFGGGPFGGPENTVQGYILPTYGLDLALRKEFTKVKGLSAALNVQDVLKTRVYETHSSTPMFIQDTYRRRDWQLVRFTLNWKFGKADHSLFKRKNTNMNTEGMEG